MWLKMVFAMFYFLVLFVFSRLMDIAVKTYELQPFSMFPSHLVINPVILSVKHLKRILDYRGISYAGFWEKHELRELVAASGDVSQEELQELEEVKATEESRAATLEKSDHKQSPDIVTHFSCGTHFYELVEDTKVSAWLVWVKPRVRPGLGSESGATLDTEMWRRVARKASEFGIRIGVFDCSLDPILCENKGWLSSRLLLAMPQVREGQNAREDVLLTTYLIGHNTLPLNIFNWIHQQLATRVKQIQSVSELNQNWLHNGSSVGSDIKLVLISSLATPPLILSALAIRFSGRVKFAMLKVDDKNRRSVMARFDLKRLPPLPIYAIALSDHTFYYYGHKPGESFTYQSMEQFLRSLKPEMNDIFLLSLCLVNTMVALNFFWMKCSKFWKHIIYWFMYIIKCNCILFLIWLAVLTLYGFPIMGRMTHHMLRICQYLATSHLTAVIRHDAQYYYKPALLLTTLIVCGLSLVFLRRKVLATSPDDNDDEYLFRDWAPWESTLLSYILFRNPIGMSLRPVSSSSIEANLEEGIELLIERLATPSIWLQPEFISSEYIKDLPLWVHLENEEEEDQDSAADEADTSRRSHSDDGTEDEDQSLAPQSSTNSAPCSSHSQSPCEQDYVQCSSTGSLHKRGCDQTPRSAKEEKKVIPVNDGFREKPPETGAPNSMLLCTDCAICLSPYRRSQLICGLPCGHSYHEGCIMPWLYRDNHCCPKCRWPPYKQKSKIC